MKKERTEKREGKIEREEVCSIGMYWSIIKFQYRCYRIITFEIELTIYLHLVEKERKRERKTDEYENLDRNYSEYFVLNMFFVVFVSCDVVFYLCVL